MTQTSPHDKLLSEGMITAIAFGGFLIIVGVVFGLMLGPTSAIGDFFSDLTGVSYPVINGAIIIPAPAHPAAHALIYQAVFSFMTGIAVLQVVILAARLYVQSRTRRIAETVGNLIFWSGGAVVAYVFLMSGTLSGWFTFWPCMIILAGASLIAQAIVYFAKRRK
jgi:hypothetical protein